MSNDKKPDFSNVSSGVTSTEQVRAQPDFSNVQSGVQSTETITGGEPDERTHTVASGETLSKISKQYYGSANRWKEIFEANRDQLDNPDLIKPGQVLRIPRGDASA